MARLSDKIENYLDELNKSLSSLSKLIYEKDINLKISDTEIKEIHNFCIRLQTYGDEKIYATTIDDFIEITLSSTKELANSGGGKIIIRFNDFDVDQYNAIMIRHQF